MTERGTTNSKAEADAQASPVISPSLRKKLQQCYEHGTRLMQQESYNFDYAHSILVECVTQDPGNLTYAEAFLENLQRKFHNNKRGALLAFGGKGPFKKALAKEDWREALQRGPEILKSNPWDVATLRGMAEACAHLGFHDVELRYLKNALDANPKDADVNRHCALSLARIGQFDQAIVCWTRVDEIKRGDDEAQRMISELQIAKTRPHHHHHHGAGKAEGSRRAAASPRPPAHEPPVEPAPTAEPVRREIRLTPRQELEQALANNPSDLAAYLELAQLHIDEDRLGEAAHVLHKALGASGNDVRIQERIEDVEMLRKKHQLAVAEKRAAAEESEANQQLVGQLRDDLNRMELEAYARRAQRYPDKLEWKFQLGFRLKRAGNLREAISCFEQARELPERRAAADLEIGECLQRQKKYDQALTFYRGAVDEAAASTVEVKKLALYRFGVLSAGLGNLGDAEQMLRQLVELDPHYKDASTHLDKIQSMRHKQA